MKNSLAHTVWECKYHVVWVPKRLRKVIFGQLRKEIGTILRRLCEYKGVELIEGNTSIDHVHMCVSIRKGRERECQVYTLDNFAGSMGNE